MRLDALQRLKWWLFPVLLIPVATILTEQWIVLAFVLGVLGAFLLADIAWVRIEWVLAVLVVSVPLSITWSVGDTGAAIAFPGEVLTGFLAGIFLYRISVFPTFDVKVLTVPLTVLLQFQLVWMGVTTLFSGDLMISAKRVIAHGLFFVVFFLFLAHAFRQRKLVPPFFVLMALAMVIPVLNTWIQHSALYFSPAWSFAVTGPFFDDHTIYGACLAFLLPALAILAVKGKLFNLSREQRLGLAFLFLFLAVAFLLSFSRAAWLSGLATLGIFVLILLRIPFSFWVAGLLLLLALGWRYQDVLVARFAQPHYVSHTEDVEAHVLSVTNLETDNSNLERLNRWKCALRMSKDRPILGFGPGMYQFEYGPYQIPPEMTYLSTFRGEKGNAHSEYLMALSETGWPGLILFVLIVGATYGLGLRLAYWASNAADRWLAIAALLGLTTFFVHGMVNAFLDQEKIAILVFGSMAILVGRYLAIKES